MTPRPNFRQRGYDKVYDRAHRIVIRDETHCHICGEPVDKTLSGRDPWGPSVDHLVPRVNGGSNARSNLRLAHLRCNSRRRDGERPSRDRPAPQHPGLL